MPSYILQMCLFSPVHETHSVFWHFCAVDSMLLVFSVQFLTPPLISVRKEATDSALIASGPTAAQWSADKAAGQQRPHSVLREKGMVMLSPDQRTAA